MSKVTDPVCKMTLDAASAAAQAEFGGQRFYFCSTRCRNLFLADPQAYRPDMAPSAPGGGEGACPVHDSHASFRFDLASLGISGVAGLLGGAGLLTVYFGLLTLVSGWPYTLDQFGIYWPFIVALAAGFGVQVGLYAYLRRAAHTAKFGKVAAVTGTTSGAAMVSCCAHYLVNILPVLGATGFVSLVGQYQVELFWIGLAANVAGIVYMGRQFVSFVHGT